MFYITYKSLKEKLKMLRINPFHRIRRITNTTSQNINHYNSLNGRLSGYMDYQHCVNTKKPNIFKRIGNFFKALYNANKGYFEK